MFYPTKQELSKIAFSRIRTGTTSVASSDRYKCENNGEGSLVRSRMAGCGPADPSSNLGPCSFIFNLLRDGALTQKQIAESIGLTTRAVRYILSRLLRDGVILQRANLLDARTKLYYIKPSLVGPRGTSSAWARQSYYEVVK